MSLVRVWMSSVVRAIISSGISSQVSSGGWSGAVSIAASSAGVAPGGVWLSSGGCSSGFSPVGGLFGGWFGGWAEDIVGGWIRSVRASMPDMVANYLLNRDLPLGWRQTQPTPRHQRQHFRQQRTRRHSKLRRRISFRPSQGNEMRTNSSSVPTYFLVAVSHNSIQAQVEVQLYHLEASYLTETTTNSGGNIITGFENYLKNQSTGRKRFEVTDSERMFSASSTTYQRVRITVDSFSIPNLKPMLLVSRTHGGG